MKHRFLALFTVAVLIIATTVFFLITESAPSVVSITVLPSKITSSQPIAPIPQNLVHNTDKVALGSRLFHDPLLSQDGTISCASCHRLTTGGVDNLTHSIGIQGQEGVINAPTVFNSYFNFVQFWDGRAANLAEQAGGPILNPIEMGNTWQQVLHDLKQHADYPQAFNKIYPEGITATTVQDAIAVFEWSLTTPNAPFDRFLRGEKDALSTEERLGYELFKQVGCISCHQGINIGGNLFQKLGIMDDYFTSKNLLESDMGRYNVTKQEADRHYFKVPSLRNIALTAPYLHDGSQKTLEEVIKVMGQYQLGKELTSNEVNRLIAFLHSLTGEYQGKPLQ